MAMERRNKDRRDFSYYMRVMNENTGELIGHMADISLCGFRLESQKPISKNTEYPLRIELSSDILFYISKTYQLIYERN